MKIKQNLSKAKACIVLSIFRTSELTANKEDAPQLFCKELNVHNYLKTLRQ